MCPYFIKQSLIRQKVIKTVWIFGLLSYQAIKEIAVLPSN